jgi:hypothetical protein
MKTLIKLHTDCDGIAGTGKKQSKLSLKIHKLLLQFNVVVLYRNKKNTVFCNYYSL